MDKKELLEKIYDKYQMEIARRDRLESKSIGYYTISGIFFAAFLVIEPLLFSKGLLIIFNGKQMLSIINYILVISYIVLFIISIIKLHNNYKPKTRPEFDPIDSWDILVSKSEEESTELIKNKLVEIIALYDEINKALVKRLFLVNQLCIASAIIIVSIFIVLLTTYYI